MNDLATQLAGIDVLDVDGNLVAVRSAWSRGPALLVFIRHFG